MNTQALERVLKLHPTDAKVYLDLLRFGVSAASTIGARTSTDRTTVYAALKRMTLRGLVASTQRKGTTLFTALDPDTLEVGLLREIQERKANLSLLRELLPQLVSLKEQGSVRPAVQIFEGPEGVVALYELMLQQSQSQCAFLTVDKLPREMKEYLTKTYILNKKKRKVSSRVLVSESAFAERYQVLDKGSSRETKIVPKEFLPFETEIIIGEKEVAVIDLKSAFFGVYIKSESIRNTLYAVFEMLWKMVGEPRV